MNYNLMMVSIFLYRHFILYVRFFIYGPISHGFEEKKIFMAFQPWPHSQMATSSHCFDRFLLTKISKNIIHKSFIIILHLTFIFLYKER